MINKKIEDITIDDIKLLIDNGVVENKKLEYKKQLDINSDGEKKEFLADISSFANTNDGDIIFGVEESSEEKVPVAMDGIEYKTEDELIRRIEDILRDSIKPRITNKEYKFLRLSEKMCILIIRIYKSKQLPHRIEFKRS